MQKAERRTAADMVSDCMRRIKIVTSAQTMEEARKISDPMPKLGSEPIVVKAGAMLVLDRRRLPERKEVSIKCDCSGGITDHFTLLRDYRAAISEQKALGPHLRAKVGSLIVASAWNIALLEGKCMKCDRVLKVNVKFAFGQ